MRHRQVWNSDPAVTHRWRHRDAPPADVSVAGAAGGSPAGSENFSHAAGVPGQARLRRIAPWNLSRMKRPDQRTLLSRTMSAPGERRHPSAGQEGGFCPTLDSPARKNDAAYRTMSTPANILNSSLPVKKSQKDRFGRASRHAANRAFISAERNSESGGLIPEPAIWLQSDGMTRNQAPAMFVLHRPEGSHSSGNPHKRRISSANLPPVSRRTHPYMTQSENCAV
jgi:hypothetical protein